uniref:NADH-ubiquinone oxidoreductase chain 2 n=1 Tax=Cyrtorhinus sp. TaxID=2931287 RepID=A0A8T9ZY75_9HEMI|nr:NADH dehydrogenase subunit 2 [Cyrtorhinus sp.]
MQTSTKMLFTFIIIMSNMMIFSSTTWMNMWLAMEMNLMSFIPMMSKPKNSFISQSMMMYFLTQSMASMMFITTFLNNNYISNLFNEEMMNFVIMMIMMMKMGMPPFHFWFPEIMNKLNWKTCFIMMTWQKMGPIYILSLNLTMNKTLILMICISSIFGAIGGLNQTSMRKILAYSSMNHLAWLMTSASMFKKSWIMYMMIYSVMLFTLTFMMYNYNIYFLNQMNIFFDKNINKIMITSMMLSLGGLPPFLGFMPKWMVIQYMIGSKEFILMLILVFSSLISMSYYLRMTSSINMLSYMCQKWTMFMKNKNLILMIMFMINMMLPLVIFSMNMF